MIQSDKKIFRYLTLFTHWAGSWRWVLISVVGLALFWLEVYEFIQLKFLNQPFHFLEVVLYAVLITGTGLFLELFVRSNGSYQQTLKILEYKHKLSLDFALNGDWESLVGRLVYLPNTIADVEETYLLVSKGVANGQFDIVGHWARNTQTDNAGWNPVLQCPKCLGKKSGKSTFHLCTNYEDASSSNVYSLEVMNRNCPTVVLKFKLRSGAQLSDDEESVFNNIGDEISVALQASEDRKRLSEMQSAEVAMAERRMVSAYVHDQLSQNLGYLHLKLDQLGKDESLIKSKNARKEIIHLRGVANDSYEIVRDFLKKLQPETVPHFTNLLREHAVRVSRAANFSLNFTSTGIPIQLLPNIQQMIFYAFYEILNNVDKHSKASNVDIQINWSESFLEITVADNGVGFDPEMVEKLDHFGLEIIKERVSSLKGQMSMNTSAHIGAAISISVPIK